MPFLIGLPAVVAQPPVLAAVAGIASANIDAGVPDGTVIDEVRYRDNIAFSTSRTGPVR